MVAIMYKCLPKNCFEDRDHYKIVTIRQEDLESIRIWRNAQVETLRQKVQITPQEQRDYFQQTIWPSFIQLQPKQLLFSFLLNGTCIGYGGLTNLDWDALRGEVSFLVDPARLENSRVYAQDFSHFLGLLCIVAFDTLNLHRLFTETYAFRTHHLTILEKFGFKHEGLLREHVFKRNQWIDSVIHGLLAEEFQHEK